MFAKSKLISVFSLATVLLLISLGAQGEDQGSTHREEMKELKKEHRKEMRKMRREHRTTRMLERVDANEDGQVDLNEYLAHAQERFNKLDLDDNGFVTQEEARESMQQMRDEHKERRKQMREERKEQRD